MNSAQNLTHLQTGQVTIIQAIAGDSALGQRIMELGFTPGISVRLMAKGAFGGALAFQVRGSMIALRRADAACVEI